MNWTVEYYKDDQGNEPVADFIDSLPVGTQTKVLRLIDLLGDYGVLLKEPYTRQIKDKIREIRIKDAHRTVRVLYFTFTGRRFILLHGFIKKTDKTPEKEIAIAEKRMTDFLQRYGGKK
ncbi:MAG: type II toxin-antitoxin system RelE/ParE family toxin [Nitrospirota bacterium]